MFLYKQSEKIYKNGADSVYQKTRVGDYLDIVRARKSPGILIFDPKNRLVYSNKEALVFLPGLKKRKIPPEILDLCIRARSKTQRSGIQKESLQDLIIDRASGLPFSIRAFSIKERGAKKRLSHIMVLVEKVVDRHLIDLDFDRFKVDFKLTKREVEILKLISEGLSNREIAARLFVSEHTAKDHVKNIIQKMSATSRSGVLARLFQGQKKPDSTA